MRNAGILSAEEEDTVSVSSEREQSSLRLNSFREEAQEAQEATGRLQSDNELG